MFPYNLLILPLLGGYFFIANFAYFKYKYQRSDTPRLLLNSILAGIIVAICSFSGRFFIEHKCPGLYNFLKQMLHLFPMERTEKNRFLGTLVYGLFSVVLLTYLLNLFVRIFWGYDRVISHALNKYGDELEQLFRDSWKNGQPVQLTLKNEKVYLGIVEKIPEPRKTNYINLIPLYSGYRDKDTKKMFLTTSYETINDLIGNENIHPKINKLLVVIKQDEILTAQPHDPEIFASFIRSEQAQKILQNK